jgi:hypothetical protein
MGRKDEAAETGRNQRTDRHDRACNSIGDLVNHGCGVAEQRAWALALLRFGPTESEDA